MPPLSSMESSSIIVGDTECCYRPPTSLFAESTALLIVDAQEENWQDCVQKDFASFPERLRETIFHCRNNDAHIAWVVQDGDSPLRSYQHSKGSCSSSRRKRRQQVHQGSALPTPQKGDLVVAKKGLSGTTNSRLISFLKSNNIDTVLVCGLWTSVCVQNTAFGVFEKGFRTLLVEDACADQRRARHEAAIALYGNYMYEMVHSSELEAISSSWVPATPPRSFLSEKMAHNKSLLRDDAASVQNISFRDDGSETSSITTATASSSTPSSVSSISMGDALPPAARLSAMAMMATMMIATVMVASTSGTNQRVVLSSR